MSYVLLESASKVLLENSFGLLEESTSSSSPSVPSGPNQGFFGKPFYVNAKSNVTTLHDNGGTLLGVALSTLQNRRVIASDLGQSYLGKHNYVGNLAPQEASTRSISAGTFGVTVANKYIIMGFTSQIAGLANNTLRSTGSANRMSENQNIGYVNTWLKAKTGGWYYVNGQPINAQNSRDHVGTQPAANRYTMLNTGKIATTSTYNAKTD